jgi:hypothetical protein
MPDKTLATKMKLKPAQRAAVINAPDGYLDTLSPLPEGVQLDETLQGTFDWVQVFVKSKAELDKLLPKVVRAALLELPRTVDRAVDAAIDAYA